MPQLSSDVQSNQAWYIIILYRLDNLFMPEMEAFPYYMIKAACNYKQACISFFDNQGVQILVILVLVLLVVRFNSFSNV